MAVKKKGLGRGLSALLGDNSPVIMEDSAVAESAANTRRRLPIEFIERNVNQPRQHFDAQAIEELSASIKDKGLLQPILVRELGPDRYEIVAGERRWRASQKAGIHDVPVVIKDLTDSEVLEIAIVENVQRQDLTPVEEAVGYRRLMNEFGHTQEVVSDIVGKSRPHVANLLRLLTLPEPVQQMVTEGQISMGHARALIGSDDPLALARQIVSKGMTVRQTEDMVGASKGRKKREPRPGGMGSSMSHKDADTLALEKDLSASTGLKVSIDHKGDDGGALTITYKTLEQLDDICSRLGVG